MNTTYFKNCVAGNVFQAKTTPALPTEYYIGLSSTPPAADGTGVTEPSTGAGYARVKLESLSEPVDGVTSNTDRISFNESTAAWSTIPYFVVYDSAAVGEGNLLMFEALDVQRSIEQGTILSFKPGTLVLSVCDM